MAFVPTPFTGSQTVVFTSHIKHGEFSCSSIIFEQGAVQLDSGYPDVTLTLLTMQKYSGGALESFDIKFNDETITLRVDNRIKDVAVTRTVNNYDYYLQGAGVSHVFATGGAMQDVGDCGDINMSNVKRSVYRICLCRYRDLEVRKLPASYGLPFYTFIKNTGGVRAANNAAFEDAGHGVTAIGAGRPGLCFAIFNSGECWACIGK